jgi:membrane protease YdiL (CAAX protease family)
VDLKKLILPVLVAFALWFVMFSPWTSPYLNFWLAMLCSGIILVAMSFLLKKNWKGDFKFDLKSVVIGIGSACLLWGVFYIGDYLSAILFDFARPQVSSIYSLRDGTTNSLIALELLLIVGPAEVIFWQGLVQSTMMKQMGDCKGFIITTLIYALVHIFSFNFMLVMAALVCGVFWGFMYMFLKPRNLAPLLISHALWDVMVFILFPIL